MKSTHPAFLFAFSCLVALLPSCKNDLKLNAPYKEMPSIYAVINPQDKIKMIRVNKVFLGEGDANKMAQVADSVNYQAGDLTITMARYDETTGQQLDACPTCPAGSPDRHVITFRDSMIQTVPGAFSTQQRVYVSGADLHDELPTYNCSQGIQYHLNCNPKWRVHGIYQLTVKNNKTGNIFTAKSRGIDSVSGSQGIQPFTPLYNPYPVGTSPTNSSFIDYSTPERVYNLAYSPDTSLNGQIYQLVIRFLYHDRYLDGSQVSGYIDYPFANQVYVTSAGSFPGQTAKYLSTTFKGADVFNTIANACSQQNVISNSSYVGRKLDLVQYFVYSSTDDYADYLQFAAPSLNIAQNKPLYSNFDDKTALGIFTFRARCGVTKVPASSFLNALQSNATTCPYQWFNYAESRHGCD